MGSRSTPAFSQRSPEPGNTSITRSPNPARQPRRRWRRSIRPLSAASSAPPPPLSPGRPAARSGTTSSTWYEGPGIVRLDCPHRVAWHFSHRLQPACQWGHGLRPPLLKNRRSLEIHRLHLHRIRHGTLAGVGKMLISPAPGSVLGTPSTTFTWTPGSQVWDYQLNLGTRGPGSSDLIAPIGQQTTSLHAPFPACLPMGSRSTPASTQKSLESGYSTTTPSPNPARQSRPR